jgi:hypothetical protein
MKMTEKLFSSLRVVFGSRDNEYDKDLLTWAKTEYGKDWRYAYEYAKKNNGQGPKMGIY